jgi:tRNA-2-methylthio-N6-dimethylallyladenosine synthase
MVISSDFIVGFPGEMKQDFEDTMDLIEEVGFDQSFSFIYSSRPGTPAAQLPDATSAAEKKERLHRLQAALTANARRISEAMVGTEQTVLIAGRSRRDDNEMAGRTEDNRVVNFPAHPRLIGRFVRVRITEALSNSLRGELIDLDSELEPGIVNEQAVNEQ